MALLPSTQNKQNESITLNVFDMDETLLHTKAMIHVVNNKKNTVKSLTNQQFNTYKLRPGEAYDFSEFGSVKLLKTTSEPIRPIIAKAKAILKNMHPQSKIIIMTARASFLNDEGGNQAVLKFFQQKYQIKFDNILTTGDIRGKTPSEAKLHAFKELLRKQPSIKKIRFFDDSEQNVRKFLKMNVSQNVVLEGYLVKGGGVTVMRNT